MVDMLLAALICAGNSGLHCMLGPGEGQLLQAGSQHLQIGSALGFFFFTDTNDSYSLYGLLKIVQ